MSRLASSRVRSCTVTGRAARTAAATAATATARTTPTRSTRYRTRQARSAGTRRRSSVLATGVVPRLSRSSSPTTRAATTTDRTAGTSHGTSSPARVTTSAPACVPCSSVRPTRVRDVDGERRDGRVLQQRRERPRAAVEPCGRRRHRRGVHARAARRELPQRPPHLEVQRRARRSPARGTGVRPRRAGPARCCAARRTGRPASARGRRRSWPPGVRPGSASAGARVERTTHTYQATTAATMPSATHGHHQA